MPITYTIDHQEKLITTVWSGEIDVGMLALHWREILKDPEALEIRRNVVDIRPSDILFTGEDMRILIQTIVIPMLEGRKWKTAIVVEAPHQFGVSRQYQIFAASYSKDAIFYDMEKARQWLLAAAG